MNYLSTVTLGDFIGPEFAACLGLLPRNEDHISEFLTSEQAEYTMCTNMAQTKVWDRLWRFGIIVDDDMDYYVPDDEDTELQLVEAEELFA